MSVRFLSQWNRVSRVFFIVQFELQTVFFDNPLYAGAWCKLWVTALRRSSVQNALWAWTISNLSNLCCHIYHSLLMCLKENQCRWCFLTWSLPFVLMMAFSVTARFFTWKRSTLEVLPEGCIISSKHVSRSLLMSVFTLKQWIVFSQRSLIGETCFPASIYVVWHCTE